MRHRQRHRYVSITIVQTPMTTPIMMESRRRRDFIIDTRLFLAGMVPMNNTNSDIYKSRKRFDSLMICTMRVLILADEARCLENSERVS